MSTSAAIGIIAVVVAALEGGKAVQAPTAALAMREIEACRVRLFDSFGRWGGAVAVYDVSTNAAGAVLALGRRIIPDREHLPKRVSLDTFEACVRRWRFDGAGPYTVTLVAGPNIGGSRIQIEQGLRQLQVRQPFEAMRP